MKTKQHNRQQLLMQAFGFTYDDLTANRSGKLTLHQRRKHRNSNILHGCAWISIGLVALVPAMLIFVSIAITMDADLDSGIATLLSIAIIGTFIGFGVAGSGVINLVFSYRDVQAHEVKRIQGLAVIIASANAQPMLTIHNLKFKMSRKQIAHIKALEPHIVYYLPKSKRIVSIETIES